MKAAACVVLVALCVLAAAPTHASQIFQSWCPSCETFDILEDGSVTEARLTPHYNIEHTVATSPEALIFASLEESMLKPTPVRKGNGGRRGGGGRNRNNKNNKASGKNLDCQCQFSVLSSGVPRGNVVRPKSTQTKLDDARDNANRKAIAKRKDQENADQETENQDKIKKSMSQGEREGGAEESESSEQSESSKKSGSSKKAQGFKETLMTYNPEATHVDFDSALKQTQDEADRADEQEAREDDPANIHSA